MVVFCNGWNLFSVMIWSIVLIMMVNMYHRLKVIDGLYIIIGLKHRHASCTDQHCHPPLRRVHYSCRSTTAIRPTTVTAVMKKWRWMSGSRRSSNSDHGLQVPDTTSSPTASIPVVTSVTSSSNDMGPTSSHSTLSESHQQSQSIKHVLSRALTPSTSSSSTAGAANAVASSSTSSNAIIDLSSSSSSRLRRKRYSG